MRTALFLVMLYVCSSCNVKNQGMSPATSNLPEITNEILKSNIVDYVKATYKDMKTPNLIYLESSISGDTTIYTIQSAYDLGLFIGIDKRISMILQIDSIDVGYMNLSNTDMEMPIEAMVNLLSDKYPSFKEDYAYYLKLKRKYPESVNFQLASFITVLGNPDVWTLKFVGDSLVYKNIRLAIAPEFRRPD